MSGEKMDEVDRMEDRIWHKHYASGVPRRIEIPELPFTYFLAESARVYPEKTCTQDGQFVISYRRMDELTTLLARALAGLGVRKGEKIGLLLPNSHEFVLTYFAILKAGGVVVAINPSYTPPEIQRQAGDASVKKLLVLAGRYEAAKAIHDQFGVDQILGIDAGELAGLESLDESSTTEQPFNAPENGRISDPHWLGLWQNIELPKVSAEDIAILQYTGGTTGLPKGAVGLHRNLVANVLQFRRWLPQLRDGEETVLAAIPLFHVYGMVLGMGLAMALGAGLILESDPRNLAGLLEKIHRYHPTVFPGVPTLYDSINNYPGAPRYDLRSLKVCISGSAALPASIKSRFETASGAVVSEGYGLSEAPTATHCNPVGGENRVGSIGLPLPGVDCRIVSLEDGITLVNTGEAGELLVRGPQVMLEYHNHPEETAQALVGGWLHTGDIARMDEDGYFYIIDRKKDLIKVGGLQVWPREVEDVIRALPQVHDVAAAGIPDDHYGEVVRAWVILKPGMNLTGAEIIEHCRKMIARYKAPAQVEFVTSFPRTTVGKVLRRTLVKEYLDKLTPPV